MWKDRVSFDQDGVPTSLIPSLQYDRSMVFLTISVIQFTRKGVDIEEHDLQRGEAAIGRYMNVPLAHPTDLRLCFTQNLETPIPLRDAMETVKSSDRKLAEWAWKHCRKPEDAAAFMDMRKKAGWHAISPLWSDHPRSPRRMRQLTDLLKPSDGSKLTHDAHPGAQGQRFRWNWLRKDPLHGVVSMLRAFGHPELCDLIDEREREGWSDEHFLRVLVDALNAHRQDAASRCKYDETSEDQNDAIQNVLRESHQRTFQRVPLALQTMRRRADYILRNQDSGHKKAVDDAVNDAELEIRKHLDHGMSKTRRGWMRVAYPSIVVKVNERMAHYDNQSRIQINELLADLGNLELEGHEIFRPSVLEASLAGSAPIIAPPPAVACLLEKVDKAASPVGLLSAAGTVAAYVLTKDAAITATLATCSVPASFSVSSFLYACRAAPGKRRERYLQDFRDAVRRELMGKSASSPAVRSELVKKIEARASELAAEELYRVQSTVDKETHSIGESRRLHRHLRNQKISKIDAILAQIPAR